MDNIYSILENRSKDLPSDQYSYKLAGANFGIDVPIIGDLQIDTHDQSLWIPVASGVRRDGVGDLLDVTGIVTERHKKNPICLFDHGKEVALPIARARENPQDIESYTFKINAVEKSAGCRAYFYTGKENCDPDLGCKQYDHALFCEQLFDMAAKGFIGAGSIGYQVIQAEHLPPDYSTGTPQGLHLKKILCLEASLVVLPASQDTVAKALTGGRICGKHASPYLVKALAPYLVLSRTQVVVPANISNLKTLDTKYINSPKLEEKKTLHSTCGCSDCQEGKSCPCKNDGHKSMDWDKVKEKIVKEGSEWAVKAPNGHTLGKHKTKEDAIAQLAAIQESKHRAEGKSFPPVKDKISKEGSEWVVRDSSGHTHGKHKTKEEAIQQLAAIQESKKRAEEKSLVHETKFIRKHGSKWTVYSHSGKPMGTYDTKEEAKKRLREIEYFKHKKEFRLDELKKKYLKSLKKYKKKNGIPEELQRALDAGNPEQHLTNHVVPRALESHPGENLSGSDLGIPAGSTTGSSTSSMDADLYQDLNPENQEQTGHKRLSKKQKSLDDLRARYKRVKGRFRRLKKSKSGSASLHIGPSDLDRLRQDANAKDVEVKLLGESEGGLLKVRLTGYDKAMEGLALTYGKVRSKKPLIGAKAAKMRAKKKSLSDQNQKAINPIGTLPSGSRSRESLEESPLEYPGSTREQGEPLAVPVLTAKQLKDRNMARLNRKIKAADELLDDSMPKPEDGGVHGEGHEDYGALLELGDDDLGDEDELEYEGEEPYGAQVVRRLHADKVGLLHEYDEFMDHTEDEPTRELLKEEMEDLVEKIEKIEEHWANHKRYKDLPELEGAGEHEHFEGDEGEEEEPNEDEYYGEDEDEALPASSEIEEEPTPDEALEGMRASEKEEKRLYYKHVKSLRNKYNVKGHTCSANSDKTLTEDEDHIPGGWDEKHGGLDTKTGKKVKNKKNLEDEDMGEKTREEEEREEEKKYLQKRWKALKYKEDEESKEEKRLISHRWKSLKKEEEEEKEEKKRKKEEKSYGPIGKFLKKFTKHHNESIHDAADFLGKLEDENEEYDDEKKHLAFYYSKQLERVVKDIFGTRQDTTGLSGLRKALLTAEEPKVTQPSSNPQVARGIGKDEMAYYEGEHLVKDKESFPKLGDGSHVGVDQPSSNPQVAKGVGKEPMQQWEKPSYLKEETYPKLGETGEFARPNDPKSNQVVAAGIGKEPMQQWGQGGSLVKHLKNVADAASFLKSLAFEKAFGSTHRNLAGRLAKALGETEVKSEFVGDPEFWKEEEEEDAHKRKHIHKHEHQHDHDHDHDHEHHHEHEHHHLHELEDGEKDLDGLEGGVRKGKKMPPEPKDSEVVGEIGEKSLDALVRGSLETAQSINALNETIARLGQMIK